MTGSQIRDLLHEKNWQIVDLAFRWGLTREALSRLISRSNRAQHWDDAFIGLARLTKKEAIALRGERVLARPPLKRSAKTYPPAAPWLQPGDLVRAYCDIGAVALEGEEGLVLEVMTRSDGFLYRISWPSGTDLFPEEGLDAFVTETGKTGRIK